jgi:hypothetical protein
MTVAEWLATYPGGFDVTGVCVDGSRFKQHHSNVCMAFGINLWRGSVWGVKADGKRTKLKSVYN